MPAPPPARWHDACLASLPVHAARAFAPVPLLFAACTTAGLALAFRAGLLGLPLALILLSWLAKYAFVLLESEAHGLPPPVLTVEMVNPFDERRPLGALLWFGVAAGITGAAHSLLGATLAHCVALVFAAAAPAALAALAIEGSWLRALNPAVCGRIVQGLGAYYAAVALAGIGYLYLAAAAFAALPRAGAIGVVAVLLLSYATLLGGALWIRRDALGLDAVADPARAAARAAGVAARALDRSVADAYGLLRAREPAQAWAILDEWLAAQRRTPEAYATLLERAAAWPDTRPAERLQRELVTRLLALGRTGDAVLAIERAWRDGRRYAPTSGRELARLLGIAAELGHARTAERLLEECGAAFASDPEVAALRTRMRVP